jgi:hypothetical protein
MGFPPSRERRGDFPIFPEPHGLILEAANHMSNKLKNIGLIGLGMVAGVAVSFQFSAFAQ